MPRIDLSLTVPGVVALLCVLAAAGIALWVYRSTLPPVPRMLRLLLAALRGAALGLTLLLLFEPTLGLLTASVEPPLAAVLVDDSRSMQLQDRTTDRAATLRAVLADPALTDLADAGSARFYRFGATLRDAGATPPESLALDDGATDIATALQTLAADPDRGNLRAVLLLTDGVSTLGRTPVADAGALGVPVYAVGIGDSAEQRDVLISRTLTNSLVYAGTEVPVDVTVKSSGLPGARTAVTLMEGGRELQRVPLTLGAGTRDTTLRFTYVAEGEGTKKFTVQVGALEGELTAANNRSSFFTRILRSKLRVLILAGGPSHDLAVIRQTLVEDPNLDVRTLTQRRPSGFYEGAFTRSAVDSADVLCLLGFPAAGLTADVLEAVRTAAEQTTPLLYLDGPGVDERLLGPLAPLLPFTGGGTGAREDLISVALAPGQARHPVLAAGPAGAALPDRLPPLFRRQGSFRSRPEAVTLATSQVLTVITPDPVILLRSVNRRRSMAVLAHGLWRWRLMAQSSTETAGVLGAFLGNSVRWLAAREEGRTVTVRPVRDRATEGEPVLFTGQVYDAAAAPVGNARLLVRARSGATAGETVLRPVGNGRYEGELQGLPAGDYEYAAEASLDGAPLGEDRGRFSVGELDLEFRETRMNIGVLRQMASRTGGRAVTADDAGELVRALRADSSFTARTVEQRAAVDLRDLPLMLGVIVLLLSLEWFLRKRNGML